MPETLSETLKNILEIQTLDMQMIRLIRVRKEREKELEQIRLLRVELKNQLNEREKELEQLRSETAFIEKKIEEEKLKIKKLEAQQAVTKKLEEFNSLTKEITTAEREKAQLSQTLQQLEERRIQEEELFAKTRQSLEDSTNSSKELEQEIVKTILEINQEGCQLKEERSQLAEVADPHVLSVYERLLSNKKDEVVVALVNRVCSGCHISLTAQHENLVRRADKLIFCEHCSRIHYLPETEVEGEAATTKRRRRRALKT
ncbi:MAG: zinc ribbon domain regulatory protein CdsZ [Chlamydiia bacterium]